MFDSPEFHSENPKIKKKTLDASKLDGQVLNVVNNPKKHS